MYPYKPARITCKISTPSGLKLVPWDYMMACDQASEPVTKERLHSH